MILQASEANPGASFNRDYLYSPGVVFVVNQQKYDESYILTSLDFLRNLLDYTTEVSGIELKLKPNANISSVQSKIEKMLGDDFVVQNRYQQQADVFRIMEIEKLISYLFLTFILMIACFNVIGSLSMLILDKKDDVITLRSLGASDKLISDFDFRLVWVSEDGSGRRGAGYSYWTDYSYDNQCSNECDKEYGYSTEAESYAAGERGHRPDLFGWFAVYYYE